MRFPVSISAPAWNVTTGILILFILCAAQADAQTTLRVATFNASLYGKESGDVRKRLSDGVDQQAERIAAIVQSVRPDVLLVNEIDYDDDGVTAALLAERFFATSHQDLQGIDYQYTFAVPSNTGIDSGLDLNGNGIPGEPDDAWGYGTYPGQYAMAIFSRYPIDTKRVRSFQRYLWRSMPGALRPRNPDTGEPFHTDAVWNRLRLSSKNHVDVPIEVGKRTVHLLASHPTPPVFDGAEDRNGCRNHDEIRFWIDYLSGPAATHLVDDRGTRGGLADHELFVIAGDLNSDPAAGDSRQAAIESLLKHGRVHDPRPRRGRESPPGIDSNSNGMETARFGPERLMRVDYALPSRSLRTANAGVFWPGANEAAQRWIEASDHRMVWIDVVIP